MAIVDVFHKPEDRRRRAGQLDVYRYDELPDGLRRQIVMILQATLGPWGADDPYGIRSWRGKNARYWEVMEAALSRELGVFELTNDKTPDLRILNFLLDAPTEQALSVIELTFRGIDKTRDSIRGWGRGKELRRPAQEPEEAIEELNHRFREHSVGYQYESGEIIRLDDEFTHAEVVRPALAALAAPAFAAADDHFRAAHHHYRDGEGPHAMGEALKALESTLKVICDRRGWSYAPNATAKPLLDVVFRKGLLPSVQQSYMAGVRVQLESGLPATANPNRHGQTTAARPPEHLVAFALRQAAASIVLLIDADRAVGATRTTP